MQARPCGTPLKANKSAVGRAVDGVDCFFPSETALLLGTQWKWRLHTGPQLQFSLCRADGRTQRRRQKNQFWKETQEVLSDDDDNDVWPGPNNPFGGPNAAAVLRDVDKRKESEREGDLCLKASESAVHSNNSSSGRLSGANKKMGVVIIAESAFFMPNQIPLSFLDLSTDKGLLAGHSRTIPEFEYEYLEFC